MRSVDKDILNQRIAAGKLAKEILGLVRGEMGSVHAKRRFVEVIAQDLGVSINGTPSPQVRDEPLDRLGAFRLPFGMHANQPLSEIPLDYLDWLVGAQEDVLKAVRSYLAHPDIRKLIDTERCD